MSTSTLLMLVTVGFFLLQAIALSFDPIAKDPGVRGGAAGAGTEIGGLTGYENFESLGEGAKQDLLNFLRSL